MTAPLLPVDVQLREDAAMGEAWRRCEAALPDGWMLEVVRWGALWPEANPHTGHPVQRRERYRATAQPTWPRASVAEEIDADGPTPTAALTALAEKLEALKDG